MRERLLQRLELMNHNLSELLNHVRKYSENALNEAPAPGKWSAAQVMNHVILAEKNSIAYCKKKLSFNPELKQAGINSKFKTLLVKIYLLSPFKFKAPKGIDTEALPYNDNYASLDKKWKEVRKELKSFINDIPETYLDKEVYKHPFGGRLSIEGMLIFFEAHFINHKKQIERALLNKAQNEN